MMKIRPFLVPVAACLGGFALAWILKSPVAPVAEVPTGQPGVTRARVTKISRPEKREPSKSPGVENLLKKYADAGYDKDKRRAVLAGVGTAEFLPLIGGVARKAGIMGLDYRQKQILEELLTEWTGRDPDAALAWILGINNSKDRGELLGVFVAKVSETDIDKAVEIVSQYGRDEEGKCEVPYQLGKKIVSQDVDSMLRLTAKFITTGAYSGMEAAFPDGYDFRKALDGLADLMSSLKSGESLSIIPSNLIEEWAKRDPSAAWEWLGKDRKVSFNDEVDFWESYVSVASTEDIARLLAESGDRYKSPGDHYRAAFRVFAEKKSPELVEQWLEAMPGDRLAKLNQLFEATGNGSGGRYDEFKNLFVSHMTPEERTRVFESRFKKVCPDCDRKFYEPLLRQLGHSNEEIRVMMPPKMADK